MNRHRNPHPGRLRSSARTLPVGSGPGIAAALATWFVSTATSAAPKPLIEYFQPIPITSSLTTSGWGIGTSGPREPDNGIEDIANWRYWVETGSVVAPSARPRQLVASAPTPSKTRVTARRLSKTENHRWIDDRKLCLP